MDRVLVVTGARGDVGAAVVTRAAAAGYDVVAADVVPPDEPSGPHVSAATFDLVDDAQVREFAADVVERCASGDVEHVGLVHCAGIARVEPFATSDTEAWDVMYRVNQRAPLLLTQALLPALTRRPESAIVFVSSDSARAGAGREVAYSATKAALIGAAKSLARELARHRARVNVVAPGPIEGQMVDSATADHEGYLERLVGAVPLRRLATPTEVAAAILWLVGPESTYVTGQTLSVSGGITMH
ncbi:2-hydroxycyclohexanecarboxyl-CoA dehydrogenase [Nocardioides sp. J9]|uniref:SDR family NAD(P)-dependent oxidoreductase n=1 Tax=unclassified Nocardioides TaxID=2615069 RepID=UPI000490BE12|nr:MULTISPECIES: SDR family oxidoreductase [unclassified Nocardioides]TWH04248.1 2-hydroxycyclohexanecarboxyl-CoA dehydrogenase [Nocardioides sp. J9]